MPEAVEDGRQRRGATHAGSGSLLPSLAFALVLLAACAPGIPDRASLRRDPASKLRPSDVAELLHFGGDNRMTVDGPVNAWAGYILGVQLSPDEVFAFYERELGTLWWQRDLLRLTQLTAETDARVWCKGLMGFRIGIEDQRRAFQPDFYRGQTFRAAYEASLSARTPGTG